ncbi:MAG: YciI family protein [Candidatus Dormibacteria bacterium]
MAKFLLAYHGGGMPEAQEEQAKVMAAWGAWFQSVGGALKDPGNPVSQARTVAPDGAVSHGGGANPVSGYSLLEAESLDAAVALAKGCPVLQGGASIEVAETFDVM